MTGTVAVIINTLSSVMIVSVNKHLSYTFHYNYALALMHSIVTYLGLLLAWLGFGFFKPARVPPGEIALLAAAFVGYIVLNNISLGLNSIAFYQATKVLCIPLVALLETIIMRKSYSLSIWLTLLTIVVGVSFVSYSNFVRIFNTLRVSRLSYENSKALMIGLVGSLVNSFYSVWTKRTSMRTRCTTSQILFAELPYAVGMLLLIMPLVEDSDPYSFSAQVRNSPLLLLSCFLAFAVNFSQFLVVGRLGPLHTTVLGHLKTLANFFIAIFVFKEPLDVIKLAGIGILTIGLALYTIVMFPRSNLPPKHRTR